VNQFHITSENTEDRFDSTDNLQDAIRIAREMAQEARAGELVCIEYQGKNIRQFVLMPNGKVKEEVLVDGSYRT
jgi:DNA integrity scanning protein DisA with diadenylate cyclase activity